MMRTAKNIGKVLGDISYKDWVFSLTAHGSGFLLSISHYNDTRCRILWQEALHGEKLCLKQWYLSNTCTDTEIVRTAYKSVMYIEAFLLKHLDFLELSKYPKNIDPDANLNCVECFEILAKCFTYKNWKLEYEGDENGILFNIAFEAPDNENPEVNELQRCRKFFITKDELWDPENFHEFMSYAIRSAEEHENNEQFLYKEKSIYNPHLDLPAMTEFIGKHEFDKGK